jgi:NAD(P)-dependent dehydrogenase (short-subunit alcohol dehydrogenase family)
MSRIFITGSSDGLGVMAAQLLLEEGHKVVLHARNEKRAKDALALAPGAEDVVVGDLSSLVETRKVAERANAFGRFDAVIHNAAVGYQEPRKLETIDGLPYVFAVNSLAPYVLTALIEKPKRLVYLSSGLHQSADTSLKDLLWEERRWDGTAAYSETKFHNVLLAFAMARLCPDICSNALDDLDQAHRTQAWLAVSQEPEALVTGKYFYHKHLQAVGPAAFDLKRQEQFLSRCQELSGASLAAFAKL